MNLLSLVLCLGMITPLYAGQQNTLPPDYAIASAHPLATNAGMSILAQGGNAFDAAIAVAATLSVVAPYHSGVGGGGFWLLHQESAHKNVFIDAREVAPKAATKTMFLGADGQVIPGLSLNGGLAAAIPGQPAAWDYIAEHYGRLPLSKTLAPAIQLAEEGFIVDKQFRRFSSMGDRLQYLKKYPATAAVFLKNGQPYEVGDRLVQKDLARTLTLIATEGKDAFYKGPIAKSLVRSVNAAGGIWTLDDLAHYQIKIREPLIGAYHNVLIITAPPPSAGGIALITMLNMLSYFPLETYTKVQWIHHVVEVMRLAYWQRESFLGDPDFVTIPVERLIGADNAKSLNTRILPNKALPSKDLEGGGLFDDKSTSTTHFSIIDKEGNRVSTTVTVNFIFGSSVVAEGTGVLLNDEMDDFSSKPGAPNIYGVIGSEKNAIEPGKRPLSSMTPTFMELPGRVAVFGTPGGSRIPSMVLLAALVFNEGYGAISMASTMRFHHQFLPDEIQFEPDTFPVAIQKELKEMGYVLMPLKQNYGDMEAITWDKELGFVCASSDPRGIGLAAKSISTQFGYGIKY